ncbi:MAG: T9SS type A sorting domain-containing protein [Bacteroidota bacterium]
MIRPLSLLGWCLVCWLSSWAQPTYLEVEGTNAVQFSIRSDGLLFADSTGGRFVLDGDDFSYVQRAGLWIGGIAPSGAIKGAVWQPEEDSEPDYQSGFLDPQTGQVLGAGQFWEVSDAEVEAQIDDFRNNLVIDDPIPSIFAWPGRNNPHFEAYNGYPQPPDVLMAPFFDNDGDGNYDPNNGDFPRAVDSPYAGKGVDKMIWFAYHTKPGMLPSGLPSPNLEIQTLIYLVNCPAALPVNQTVYFNKRVVNRGFEVIDSLHVGMYTEASIGCLESEYLGTHPESKVAFVYDATPTEDECLAGAISSPVLAVRVEEWWASDYEFINRPQITMPIIEEEATNVLLPPGMLPPDTPVSYFHYLSGSWRDGTPLTSGGNGFQNSSIKQQLIFPDAPYNSEGWSEQASGLSPGKRSFLNILGDERIAPGGYQEYLFSFTVFDQETNNQPYDNLDSMYQRAKYLQQIFFFIAGVEPFYNCDMATSTTTPGKASALLQLFPNPAREQVHLQLHQGTIEQVRLLGMDGKMLQQFSATNSPIEQIDIAHLRAGVYIVQVVTSEGTWANQKLVVSR